jgi:putative transcriptional regulator
MIRFRLADVLKRKGWTPYRLSQETGLTIPTAYRLADAELRFGRFTTDTLDRLCRALEVQPGDLLEWVPEEQDSRRHAKVGRQQASG